MSSEQEITEPITRPYQPRTGGLTHQLPEALCANPNQAHVNFTPPDESCATHQTSRTTRGSRHRTDPSNINGTDLKKLPPRNQTRDET